MTIGAKIAALYDRLENEPLHPVWISLVPRAQALARATQLEGSNLPLAGLTFAAKDNIDVAGIPTTAGCPAYAYSPDANATVIDRLEAAGAILVGKTNMDQFATGLVGTRSPYGACSSIFGAEYISGGSSSGSAVAVARGLVDFSLGTDTAGSGRVPAAFNNLIGLKPTRGVISAAGVVPACRTLDCVSIFARTPAEASKVLNAARGIDARDSFTRLPRAGEGVAPWLTSSTFRFGVPRPDQLEFFGDTEAARLFANAAATMEAAGGQRIEIDFSVFRQTADLLYSGPWVAERLAAIRQFIGSHAEEMNPTVRGIISGGNRYSAVDAFDAQYKLRDLTQAAEMQWTQIDVLLLPTTGTIFTHAQVAAEPVKRNTDLGYYTNFVNLMDLAAVAYPAGFRQNGLPFGVSLIGRAFTEAALLALSARVLKSDIPAADTGCVEVAVVGAHLEGQPLNWQLKDRGARLVRTCRTAPGYRLYALAGTLPPKPGLVRDSDFAGPGIEVEVWAMPQDQFGTFVAAIPPPLGIGSAALDSGAEIKCFICEPYAIAGAREITDFGGWRKYLASSKL